MIAFNIRPLLIARLSGLDYRDKMKSNSSGRLIASLLLAVSFQSQIAVAGSLNDARDHTHQGIMHANMNDFSNAIREFKASIAATPTVDAYSNLGASYLQLGKRNLALRALQSAERLNSSDRFVAYNLAATHSLKNNTDLALEYLDKALGLGFSQYDAIRFDPDLANLRGEPEFRQVLEKHKVFIQ